MKFYIWNVKDQKYGPDYVEAKGPKEAIRLSIPLLPYKGRKVLRAVSLENNSGLEVSLYGYSEAWDKNMRVFYKIGARC